MYRCTIKCNLRIYAHVWKGYGWPFCGGVATRRGLVPPPQILGVPPPPAVPHKKSCICLGLLISRMCLFCAPTNMLMCSWNMLQKWLFYHCYAFVNLWLFPRSHPILTRWWPFILVSLFRLKKRTFFLGGGGGSAQNVSAPLPKSKALSAPSPTWKS